MPEITLALKWALPVSAAAAVVIFTALWLISLRLKDASIIDIYWGPGFAVNAAIALAFAGRTDAAAPVLFGAVVLWAVRLGLHIGLRWRHHEGEDRRYAAMRKAGGPGYWRKSFFSVFMLQAGLQWLIGLPVMFALTGTGAASPAVLTAGILIFASGFVLEALADEQLRRFKKNAVGAAVCDVGLWRYSRHPNYFGEAVLWWGLWVICAAMGAPLATAICPALMTFLLLRVSGVPMLEHGLSKTKPGYAAYIARTSAFMLWPPRK